ncbi:unnamed protein product [Symbiodinium sp. CCMP2592]|nr:unnamed protein product [Symbiodinium sp. CCMP2592]CAE7833713.1 unnamed protein product [Symbiodinium sp. CCMP2592]
MEVVGRTRLKVLDSVTAPKLQGAIEEGLKHMGHRSLERMVCGLENMSWKTAITGHVAQICAMEGLLICLLGICSNGLLPHKMLETALLSCHKATPFEMSRPANATGPNWQDACIKYLMLRLRMITGKIREIAVDEKERAKALKKTSLQQQACILKLCRILNPGLAALPADSGTGPLPLQLVPEANDSSEDERQIERNFKLLLGPSDGQRSLAGTSAAATLQLAQGSTEPAQGSTEPSSFLERANKRALAAALACSPAKPMSKKARMETIAEARNSSPGVLKKPAAAKGACKRPAAAEPVVRAAAEEPTRGEPAKEVLQEDGILLTRYGCTKDRGLLFGCSQCKKWAADGKHRYIVLSSGHIAQKKQ